MTTARELFWNRPEIHTARQSLWYWKNKILDGFTDDKSLERYSMWHCYFLTEHEKVTIVPKPKKEKLKRPYSKSPGRGPRAPREPKMKKGKREAKKIVPEDWEPTPLSWD